MEPNFITDKECIERWNTTKCIVTESLTKLSRESAGFNSCWIELLHGKVELRVQYVDVCESPTYCDSCCDVVVGPFMTFFASASLLSKVIKNGYPKCSKSSRVPSFSIFFSKFSIAWLGGYTESENSCIKSLGTLFNKWVSKCHFTIKHHSDKTICVPCNILFIHNLTTNNQRCYNLLAVQPYQTRQKKPIAYIFCLLPPSLPSPCHILLPFPHDRWDDDKNENWKELLDN